MQVQPVANEQGIRTRDTIWVTKMPMGHTAGICGSDTPELGFKAVGAYFRSGLDLGQKIALIANDDVLENIRNFKQQGFDFTQELEDGRLNYIFYKSHLFAKGRDSISFPFREIQQLCDVDVARIAILDIERFFSLDDETLANQVKEFLFMCSQLPYTVLGQFTIRSKPQIQKLLDEVEDHESFIRMSAGTGQ